MARPKGSRNRKPEDSAANLIAHLQAARVDSDGNPRPCIQCGRIPPAGVVLPGFHDWARKSTATLDGLKERIATIGLHCRSCLSKEGKRRARAKAICPADPDFRTSTELEDAGVDPAQAREDQIAALQARLAELSNLGVVPPAPPQ